MIAMVYHTIGKEKDQPDMGCELLGLIKYRDNSCAPRCCWGGLYFKIVASRVI